MVSNMANTFFWKHNDEVERKCKTEIAGLKALLNALINLAVGALPAVALKAFNNAAVVNAYNALQASEDLAIKTAQVAEEAMDKEASAVQETVAASEAEAIAESNLESFQAERNTAGTEGPSSEGEGSLVAEQSMLENKVAEAQTRKTVSLEEQKRLAQVAEDAKVRAIIDRVRHTKRVKTVTEKGDKPRTEPEEGTFDHKVWDAKNYIFNKLKSGWLAAPYSLYALPTSVSYRPNASVA